MYVILTLIVGSCIVWIFGRSRESLENLKFMLKQLSKLWIFLLIIALFILILGPIIIRPFIYEQTLLLDKINLPTIIFFIACIGLSTFLEYLDKKNDQKERDSRLFALELWFMLLFFSVLFLFYGPNQIAGLVI